MLEFLRHELPALLRRKVSDRQLRLLAVACVRRIADLFRRSESPQAIVLAEQFADAPVSFDEAFDAQERAFTAYRESEAEWSLPDWAACVLLHVDAGTAAYDALTFAVRFQAADAAGNVPESPVDTAEQSVLVRDIFGNPFLPVVADPSWRTSTVKALAVGIYDGRAFDRLPILADALQDAGCEDEQLLGHCRGPGPHVRGCWAIDLVLGK
jgi:hypothetical protein